MATNTNSSKKLVVVVGATGGQGGSVIKRLLGTNSYRLRGLTRNPQSETSKALTAQGVEMVAADLNDQASLTTAFKDANIIFAFTNYFEGFTTSSAELLMQTELTQGINLAKAATATASLEHYIWSTLPSRSTISSGKWAVPHCDAKARVDEFIKRDGALLAKTTFVWIAFFASVMAYPMFTPNLLESAGKYVALQPVPASTEVVVAGDQATNVGVFVHAIIRQPELTLNGKYVFVATETITMGKLFEYWSEATGKEVEYVEISLEDFDRLWPKWGREVGLDLKCSNEFKVWIGENHIGKEELGLGDELIGFRDAVATMLKAPQN